MDGSSRRLACGSVLVIGFGRFGQIVSQPLLLRGVDVSIIDNDVEMIQAAADFGFKVYYGDGTRLDILHAAGAGQRRGGADLRRQGRSGSDASPSTSRPSSRWCQSGARLRSRASRLAAGARRRRLPAARDLRVGTGLRRDCAYQARHRPGPSRRYDRRGAAARPGSPRHAVGRRRQLRQRAISRATCRSRRHCRSRARPAAPSTRRRRRRWGTAQPADLVPRPQSALARCVRSYQRKKSVADMAARSVFASLICMSAARLPLRLISTSRSAPAMSLMRTWPTPVKPPLWR